MLPLNWNTVGAANFQIDNAATRPWLACARMQIPLPITYDANTSLFSVSIVGHTVDKFIGVRPATSAAKIVYGIDTIDERVSSLDFPLDGLFHWWLLGYGGIPGVSALSAFFDKSPTPIGSFVPTVGQIEFDAQAFRTDITDAASAVEQQAIYDKIAILTVEA